ncbi:hypothetical protein BU15DRAFT_59515 [Melanogaster broomeanus]|nr:hypothetical protein BU15DRAFT_59515 [Melanogaster broomeanus]
MQACQWNTLVVSALTSPNSVLLDTASGRCSQNAESSSSLILRRKDFGTLLASPNRAAKLPLVAKLLVKPRKRPGVISRYLPDLHLLENMQFGRLPQGWILSSVAIQWASHAFIGALNPFLLPQRANPSLPDLSRTSVADLDDLALYSEFLPSVAAEQARIDGSGILPPNTLMARRSQRWCRVTTVVKLLQIKLGQTPPHKPCMPRGMIVPDPPRRSCGEWGIRCHLTTIIASSIKFPVPGKYNISLSLHKGKNEQADSCCIGPASDSDQDIVVLASDAQTESPASVWHLTEVIKESGKYDIHVEDSTTDRTAAPGIDGGLHATGDVTTWEINACGDGHWLVMDVSGNHWTLKSNRRLANR